VPRDAERPRTKTADDHRRNAKAPATGLRHACGTVRTLDSESASLRLQPPSERRECTLNYRKDGREAVKIGSYPGLDVSAERDDVKKLRKAYRCSARTPRGQDRRREAPTVEDWSAVIKDTSMPRGARANPLSGGCSR